MSKTTEDFEKARQSLDVQANRNSNPNPIPTYTIADGRVFHGFGKKLPSSPVVKAA